MALDLVVVDKARFHDAIEMYFLWKKLDEKLFDFSNNKVELPKPIVEIIACYVLGFKLNKKNNCNIMNNKKLIKTICDDKLYNAIYMLTLEYNMHYILNFQYETDEILIYKITSILNLKTNIEDLNFITKININELKNR